MERSKLLTLIMESLLSIKDSSIGEGNQGIVVDKFPVKEAYDICAKYSKFGYNPNEYPILEQAYKYGLPVPEPLGEWPEHKVFAMRRIFGKTLEELKEKKFSEDVIEEIVSAVNDVCLHIFHNDLAPRNIMLEDIEMEGDVVTGGTAYVIDFGQSHMCDMADTAKNDEGDVIKGWLLKRKAK